MQPLFYTIDRFRHRASSKEQLKAAIAGRSRFKFETHEDVLQTILLAGSQGAPILLAGLLVTDTELDVRCYYEINAARLFRIALVVSVLCMATVVACIYLHLKLHPYVNLLLIVYPVIVLGLFLVSRRLLTERRKELILGLRITGLLL